jgi:hypothetical protein
MKKVENSPLIGFKVTSSPSLPKSVDKIETTANLIIKFK